MATYVFHRVAMNWPWVERRVNRSVSDAQLWKAGEKSVSLRQLRFLERKRFAKYVIKNIDEDERHFFYGKNCLLEDWGLLTFSGEFRHHIRKSQSGDGIFHRRPESDEGAGYWIIFNYLFHSNSKLFQWKGWNRGEIGRCIPWIQSSELYPSWAKWEIGKFEQRLKGRQMLCLIRANSFPAFHIVCKAKTATVFQRAPSWGEKRSKAFNWLRMDRKEYRRKPSTII